MYSTNSERNRVIHELWENNLTVEEISSRTGIPRSTVGYYVRKFNRLSEKGKPVVFSGPSKRAGRQGSYEENSDAMTLFQTKIINLMIEAEKNGVKMGNLKDIHYRLSVLKLLKELGFLTGKGRGSFLRFLASDITRA